MQKGARVLKEKIPAGVEETQDINNKSQILEIELITV